MVKHSRKHKFDFTFKPQDFLNWTEGQVRQLKVGTTVKKRNKDEYETRWKVLKVPLIYIQLICQLLTEEDHGKYNSGHEAVRRQSYASRVLDEVAKEFKKEFKDWKSNPSGIRFRVLNHILQRYYRGIPDSYTPVVCGAIAGPREPTIRDVTCFYLLKDPVDLKLIPHYCRNLLFNPESRWFLAVLYGKVHVKDVGHFNKVRVNHDNVMEVLRDEDESETMFGEQSFLREVEVRAIFDEGLEEYFEAYLKEVVRNFRLPNIPPLTLQFRSLNLLRRSRPN